MGADLILYMLPAAEPTDERKEFMKAYAADLDMKQGDGGWIDEADHYDLLSDFLDEGELEFDAFGFVTKQQQEEIRKGLLSTMETYWDWWDGGCRRDICPIDSDGRTYYVTGGMSWGDIPTDSASVFEELSLFPGLIRQLQEWALQDAVKYRRGTVEGLAEELTAALGGPSG